MPRKPRTVWRKKRATRCGYCRRPISYTGRRPGRPRLFCDNVCKQRAYRSDVWFLSTLEPGFAALARAGFNDTQQGELMDEALEMGLAKKMRLEQVIDTLIKTHGRPEAKESRQRSTGAGS